jgi:hypothetical protein
LPLSNISASVNACKITSKILSRVYLERKASRRTAYDLSMQFSEWMNELPSDLHWRQISLDRGDHTLTLKRLHINLIYFHGIILLTRPFLLYEINHQLKRTTDNPTKSAPVPEQQSGQDQHERPEYMFCFHGACIRSAVHTITAIHTTYMSEALPRKDPFVMYDVSKTFL